MVHHRLRMPLPARVLAPVLVFALTAVTATPLSAQAAGEQLEFAGTYGGPGHAEMYASGMEIAPDGSVVIADTGNHQIAKYGADGTPIWRIGAFGNGTLQFDHPRDLGIDSLGNIYVADTGNTRVVKLDPSGGWITSWKGPDADRMGTPMGITVTNDIVYVADAGKQRVRLFTTSGTPLQVMSSNGVCAFAQVRDADADALGNVYVANYTNNDVLKLSPSGTCLTKWGVKGTGNGQFKNPYGVRIATDPVLGTQAVYVADSNNSRMQEFHTDGSYVTQVGGVGSPSEPGTLFGLRRVAVAADGDLWAADMWAWRVERWDRSASGYTYAQTIGAVPPPLTDSAVFNEVRGIDFDASGTIFAMDTINERIVRMTKQGNIIGACGERGWDPGEFNWPRGLAVDDATNDVWLADTKQSRIQIVRPDCTNGVIVGSVGTGLAEFDWPSSVAIRQSDRIAFVADTNNDRVVAYDVATRAPIGTYNGLLAPSGVDVDPTTGHVLVADTGNDRIVELSATSGGSFSLVRTLTSGFNAPEGVSSDSAGHVFVADTLNDRLVVLAANGSLLQVVTEPTGFDDPAEVAVDPDGRVMVGDTLNDRIQVYTYPSVGGGTIVANKVLTAPNPAAFTFAPDGRIVYGDKTNGEIHIAAANGSSDTLVWDVSNMATSGEDGIVGVAVHPNFPTTPYIYVAATRIVKGLLKLQVMRITVNGAGVGTGQLAIYTTKGATSHLGGRLMFGPDGKLYLSTGDIRSAGLAQKTADPHGKILRMNADGTVPADNPIAGSRVFARGLRSPVGADADPVTGTLWSGDLGPSCNDEVNRVTRNVNLGWGSASSCSTPPAPPANTNQSGTNPTLPKFWWGAPIGPRGLTFCAGCGLGASVDGTMLIGTVNTNEIRSLTMNGPRDGVVSQSPIFTHTADVLGLESAPDGTVYFSDTTGIWKLALT
jgi:glucose/arabinose dehydrogenase/streptogramin lyase